MAEPDKDDIDPELVNLRRSGRVRPVLALAVLGFAIHLGLLLRDDFAYSFRGDVPREVTDAAAVPDNTYVGLHGFPEYGRAARLRGRQDIGHRLVPVVGSRGAVWLHEIGEAPVAVPRTVDRVEGRLRRLDDLAFAGELRRHVASLPPQPRFVYPEAFRGGLPDRDVYGVPLAPAPDARVVVTERVAGVAEVIVVQTEQVYDEAAAARLLVAAGVLAAPAAPSAKDDASWSFEVPAAEGEAAVLARLRAAKVFGAGVRAKMREHEGRWGALAELPVADAVRIAVFVPPDPVPAGARVLLVGETPARYWYTKPLYAGLALIALLMVWSLSRLLRR